MGYKVHTVDGKAGEVDLTHLRKRVANVVVPTPAAGMTIPLAQLPTAATVTAVKAWRTGGTAANVNASTASGNVLAADLVAGAGAWANSNASQHTAVAAGDTISALITAATGAPTSLTIQVEYTISVPA